MFCLFNTPKRERNSVQGGTQRNPTRRRPGLKYRSPRRPPCPKPPSQPQRQTSPRDRSRPEYSVEAARKKKGGCKSQMAVALTNKFRDSCKLYVAGKRDAPRFKRLGDSISLQYQVQKDSPTPIVEGDLVRLDKLVGDICNAVPVILHRPVPKGATIKQVALTIRGPRMFVVFMIDVAAEAQSVSLATADWPKLSVDGHKSKRR